MESIHTAANEVAATLSLLDGQPEAAGIGEGTSLRDELGFDSLKMVELMVALEERFAITIGESDLDPQALETVGDLYDLVDKYRAG